MNGMGLETARLRVYAFSNGHSYAPVYEQSGSLGVDWIQQRITVELTQSTEVHTEYHIAHCMSFLLMIIHNYEDPLPLD